MFALSTRFKCVQAVLYAVFNAGVITHFKMQAVIFFKATPVSAIQGVFANDTNGAGDNFSIFRGKNKEELIRDCFKKIQAESR